MNDENNNDPEVEATLDEHLEWVDQAVEHAAAGDWAFVERSINAQDADKLPGMIFVLISTRAGDAERMREEGGTT